MGENSEIDYTSHAEHFIAASQDMNTWFADFVNYLASDIVLPDLSFHQRTKFMHDVKNSFGMSSTYIGVVLMVLFGVVCRKLRC